MIGGVHGDLDGPDAGGRPFAVRPYEIISLAALGALCWGVLAGQLTPATPESEAATGALLALAGGGWLAWVILRRRPDGAGDRMLTAALVVSSACGGALVALAPTAVFFVGVAEMHATLLGRRWSWPAVGAAGLVAAVVAVAASGARPELALLVVTAAVTGALVGIIRWDSTRHQAQAHRLEVAEARREAEEARAEMLAARNHLARELHDVLSHTLSAISLQLEVLDGLLSGGGDGGVVAGQLRSVKRLVRDGLQEARGAVAALRDDQPPLPERLALLAADRGAALEVTGCQRVLEPEVALGLYRATQEALTNVAKHAPGVCARVQLGYDPDRVSISVSNPLPNGAPPSPLAGTGGGYGIEGIAERVRLLGGRLEVGPCSGGWRVLAEVPA